MKHKILSLLETQDRPLLAREIADKLRTSGVPGIQRKHVNQLLYGVLRESVKKDAEHKWSLRTDPNRSSDEAGGNRERKTGPEPRTISLDEAYDLLDLLRTASTEEVKRAYKQKIGQWHPDKLNTVAKELQDIAAERTTRINAAYKVIKEHRHRAE